MAENQLKKLFEKIEEILKNEELISIHIGEGILVINDKQTMATTQAMDKLIKHFINFKITDLEIRRSITLEELREFLQILCHSEESSKMYPDLNTACEKNQITHIKSLQAAYIRVPKGVKDKLGGKTVGELKISNDEMNRLVSYLKGDINLTYPKETKIYEKIFNNAEILNGFIDKIIVAAKDQSTEEKKKLLLTSLNQIGKYLVQDSINASRKKQGLEVINKLKEVILKSQTFSVLGADNNLKAEIEQTIDRVKSLVNNQALVAEYSKHQKKLSEVETKIKKVSPELLNNLVESNSNQSEVKKLLTEIKNFLEKIKAAKNLTEDDIKKIDSILEAIQKI